MTRKLLCVAALCAAVLGLALSISAIPAGGAVALGEIPQAMGGDLVKTSSSNTTLAVQQEGLAISAPIVAGATTAACGVSLPS